VGWRNIIEKMHMTATLTKWYEEHGRHEIFAGGKNVKMESTAHSLLLKDELVTNEEQHDLDKLGIAKEEQKLLGGLGAQIEQFLGVLEFLVEFEFGFLEDLNTGTVKYRQKVVNLRAIAETGAEIGRQHFAQFVIKGVRFLLAPLNYVLQAIEFIFGCH